MMKIVKQTVYFIAFLLFAFPVFAQDQLLRIDQLMTDRSIMAKALSQRAFIQENYFFYVLDDQIHVENLKSQKTSKISLDDWNKISKSLISKTYDRIPFFEVDPATQTLLLREDDDFYYFDPVSKKLTKAFQREAAAANIRYSSQRGLFAYTLDNNIYLMKDGEQKVVTFDKNPHIVNGATVHRNEFGIDRGLFWSPNNNFLAYYRMDESMVTDYPLVDIVPRPAAATPVKYPMAGMTSHEVTIGVYDLKKESSIFLQTGAPKDQYLTSVTWSPDEQYIYVGLLNRAQNEFKLNRYQASDGKFDATLFTESNDRYVEPQSGIFFLPNKADQFLWLSQRDGYMHLYLYNTAGDLIKQLTSGEWLVQSLLGFSEKGDEVYFMCTKDSPLETQLYAAKLADASLRKITSGNGTNYISKHPRKDVFFCTFTNQDTARIQRSLDGSGKVRKTYVSDINPLKDYAMPKTEIFTIKSEDEKTDLYCRMIKPHDFDDSKKYPVIVYVYGGPHAQMITNSWLAGGNLFFQFLAQQGYLVFTLDNRGSGNRGFAFESVIHRQAGVAEMADQMKGVEYLKSLPYVDQSRLAVDGWSYGGFMSMSMKLKNPGVFKVATAGGPVIDWQWYEVMYTERYMDTPEENPEGYENASLLNYVDQLDGRLLVIHGGLDDVVVWQNSLMFIDKCIKQGKQVDYFVYPRYEHNVRGKDRGHLFQKLYDYYQTHL